MLTGWQLTEDDQEWYYMRANGVMATGWLLDGGKWYYLDGEGIMKTGWVKVGADWFHMNSSGVMSTGWRQVGTPGTGWTRPRVPWRPGGSTSVAPGTTWTPTAYGSSDLITSTTRAGPGTSHPSVSGSGPFDISDRLNCFVSNLKIVSRVFSGSVVLGGCDVGAPTLAVVVCDTNWRRLMSMKKPAVLLAFVGACALAFTGPASVASPLRAGPVPAEDTPALVPAGR